MMVIMAMSSYLVICLGGDFGKQNKCLKMTSHTEERPYVPQDLNIQVMHLEGKTSIAKGFSKCPNTG